MGGPAKPELSGGVCPTNREPVRRTGTRFQRLKSSDEALWIPQNAAGHIEDTMPRSPLRPEKQSAQEIANLQTHRVHPEVLFATRA